jgi:hypothetical protein
MVHVEHASVASAAVMASLGFENVAHQAVTTTLVLRVAQVKAPKDRNLAGVSGHGLYEGPDEHDEEHMEDCKQREDFNVV